ncbi:MAG: amino acid ABC transporter permease [Roseburia sp.]|nr:amino acid ABC transporter permease [Roseburia sp.]
MTLLIVLISVLIGIVIGIMTAFVRINRIPVLYQISGVYISFIRGTPQIVQLFLVYYGLPVLLDGLFGVDLNRLDAIYFVLIAYGLNEGAFLSEMFRGGLSAIPAGQYEAGYAAGLTRIQTFFRIIIPQAVRIVLPGFAVDLIMLFQNTSLASSIGVRDLMGRAGLMATVTKHTIENYFCAALIFVVISILLEFLFHTLSRKMDFTARQIEEEKNG